MTRYRVGTAIVAAVLSSPICGQPIISGNRTWIADRSVFLESRATKSFTGMQYCGNFANGNAGMVESLAEKLNAGDMRTRVFVIEADGCNRVQCWDTSGIYVCNDNSYELQLTGADIFPVARYLQSDDGCCKFDSNGDAQYSMASGQQFTQWGWNVVVGYANCNNPNTVKPAVTGGYGVNYGENRCEARALKVTGP